MTRDEMLARVRGALGRAPGDPVGTPPAPAPAQASWDRSEAVARFAAELEAAGGSVRVASGEAEAEAILRELARALRAAGARTWLGSSDAVVARMRGALEGEGLEPAPAGAPFSADVGVTGARAGLATTGTLVLTSDAGRFASLLPMTHVALLEADAVVPGMAEALARHAPEGTDPRALPSGWIQATGPSRTADIELTLTTGVHGPGVVHVIVIEREG